MPRTSLNTIATIPCLICEAKNSLKTALCNNCHAPMALTHQYAAQQQEPCIVSIVGESNVGKTVYLGFLLDMLAQRAGKFDAVPKGAYSVDLQQTVISYMASRIFPPKTAMEVDQWHWAYYQVRKRCDKSKWVDLIMPDMAGESLAAEIAMPQTCRVISNLLGKSAGLLMLIDAGLAANGSSRPDFFTLKLLSYIDTIYAAKQDQWIDMPIGIILCKSDYCPECFDNPQQFVKANLNRTWNMCENRFKNVQFFACSVVGSLGYATSEKEDYVVPIPLHTALQGVLEPFEWIIQQL